MGEWQGIPSPGGAAEPDFRAQSFAPPGLLICDASITHGSRRGLFSLAPPVLGLAQSLFADLAEKETFQFGGDEEPRVIAQATDFTAQFRNPTLLSGVNQLAEQPADG